jgi:hydrogenase small subunit
MAGSGVQAEKCLRDSMQQNFGYYVLVVEGSIPRKNGGVYMKLAGKSSVKVLEEVAAGAAAIIAIGSCASWGGIPSADPNPTGAVGVDEIIKDVPIVNIPGCPPNPYTLLGVVLQFATNGTLPELDDQKRPKFAFDRTIHDHCPRRPHFDAGQFVRQYGDEGHRKGWCLYEMGCKGPDTHAGCSTRHFNEVVDAWPIGIGAPCIGCTEKHIAFRKPMFSVVPIHHATPPDSYPPVKSEIGKQASPVATAIVAGVAGAIIGGAVVASKRVQLTVESHPVEPPQGPSNGGAQP